MGNVGLRERKRRDTYQKIAEAGLRLFIEHGYGATTLEMVAEDVGIARRTFFAYFKSKDEILLAWERLGWEAILDQIRTTSPEASPLRAVRSALDRAIGQLDEARLQAITGVITSSPGLMAARHASYAEREATLYQALCEVWRVPGRRPALRLVAMVSVGALRVAAERWQQDDNKLSLKRLFRQSFDGVEELLSRA